MSASEETYTVTPTPYPAKTSTAARAIHNLETTATCISFADKILITISQEGKLGHWLHIPLNPSDASDTISPFATDADSSLLPNPHLTATTILGGTLPDTSILGQTLATQIASLLTTRDPRERRMVVVGLGLDRRMVGAGTEAAEKEKDGYAQLVELVLEVL